MASLAEAVIALQNDQILVGKIVTRFEFLKVWVHRRAGRYDLYVTSTVDVNKLRPGMGFRNTVGKEFESADELLEAVRFLDSIYPVRQAELLEAPVSVRPATPELVEMLERQLNRVTSSLQTGIFTPDDLAATVVRIEAGHSFAELAKQPNVFGLEKIFAPPLEDLEPLSVLTD